MHTDVAGNQEQNAKLEQLRQELDALTAQESLLPLEHAKLNKALEQKRQLLVDREMALQQTQVGKDNKLAELNKGCTMYRNMLGLEFERVGGAFCRSPCTLYNAAVRIAKPTRCPYTPLPMYPDERLRLVMTSIDARAPSRAFSFMVYVDPTDRYHSALASYLLQCPCDPIDGSVLLVPPPPPVPVEQCDPMVPELASLVEKLNQSNDFSAFVRGLRREFKKLCV